MKNNDRITVTVNGRTYTAVKTKMRYIAIAYDVYLGDTQLCVGKITKSKRNDEKYLVMKTHTRVPGHVELAHCHKEHFVMDDHEIEVHGICNYLGMNDLEWNHGLSKAEKARAKFEKYISDGDDVAPTGYGDISSFAEDIETCVKILDMIDRNQLTGLVIYGYEYDSLRQYYSDKEIERVFGSFTVIRDEDDDEVA